MLDKNFSIILSYDDHYQKFGKLRNITSKIAEKHSLDTEKFTRMASELIANSISYAEDKQCELDVFFQNDKSYIIIVTRNKINSSRRDEYLNRRYKCTKGKIFIALGADLPDLYKTHGRGIFIIKNYFGIYHFLTRGDPTTLTTVVFDPVSMDPFMQGIQL